MMAVISFLSHKNLSGIILHRPVNSTVAIVKIYVYYAVAQADGLQDLLDVEMVAFSPAVAIVGYL